MFCSRTELPAGRARALTFDRSERRVLLDNQSLDLSPLLLSLVQHLAERRGRLVTRVELKRLLWPYAERIDTERRLNTAMRALRAALGDDADAPRYIETVRSHGYRWIANDRASRRPKFAARLIVATGLILALSPQSTLVPTHLEAALKAQNAMEQWRRQPDAAHASQAAELMRRAGDAGGDAPSLLAMRAELELGSDWRWSAADQDYRRALAADPSNSDARLGLAWLRANQGRTTEALALVTDLLGTGIQSGDRRATLGWLLIRIGRADLAAETCGADSFASVNDLSCSHEALARLGRYPEAKTVALAVMARTNASAAAVRQVARRRPAEAYRSFLKWRARHFLPANAAWFHRAQVLADAGENGEALRALERSVAAHEPLAVKILSTPSFAALRGNSHYRLLVKRVGLSA